MLVVGGKKARGKQEELLSLIIQQLQGQREFPRGVVTDVTLLWGGGF